MLSKVIKFLEKSNTRMNINHLETNRLQKTLNAKPINKIKNIRIRYGNIKPLNVWKYK